MTSEHQAQPLRIGVIIIFKNDGLYKLISLDKFQNESMSQESFQESQAFTSSKLCWREHCWKLSWDMFFSTQSLKLWVEKIKSSPSQILDRDNLGISLAKTPIKLTMYTFQKIYDIPWSMYAPWGSRDTNRVEIWNWKLVGDERTHRSPG